MALRALAGAISESFAEAPSTMDVICDGIFMTTISADVIVAKMAGRGLHGSLVLGSLLLLAPRMHLAALFFATCYYISVIGDLKDYLNLPVLQMCQNVYCDGIYDMC